MEKSQKISKAQVRGIVICSVLFVLLCLNVLMIFSFSGESREESGNRSEGVTEKIVKILYSDYDEMTEERQQELIHQFHRPIRKLAHFSEFGLLGMLSCGVMLSTGVFKNKYRFLRCLIPIVFCLVCAAGDEIFQIFTHRGASAVDACIDFAGSLVGNGVVWLLAYLVARRKAKGNIRANERGEGETVCESQDTV